MLNWILDLMAGPWTICLIWGSRATPEILICPGYHTCSVQWHCHWFSHEQGTHSSSLVLHFFLGISLCLGKDHIYLLSPSSSCLENVQNPYIKYFVLLSICAMHFIFNLKIKEKLVQANLQNSLLCTKNVVVMSAD